MHTEVPKSLRGRGIAGMLAKTALEFAREKNLKVDVICPVVAGFPGTSFDNPVSGNHIRDPLWRCSPPNPQHKLLAFLVSILVNFLHREGWSVHCLAADAKTPISPWLEMEKENMMPRLFRAAGTMDEDIASSSSTYRSKAGNYCG